MFTRRRLALLVVGATLVVTGCSVGSDGSERAASNVESSPVRPPARLQFDLGSRPVQPDHVVTVTVTRGMFTSVALTNQAGEEVDGGATGRTWTTTEGLAPSSAYTLIAVAENATGRETSRRWTFRTAAAPVTDLPAVTPLDGSTVGVGHPVIVYFDQDVTDKATVEEQLTLTASRTVDGAWGWIDDRTIAWRPKEFWPGNTDVSLDVDLAGTQVADGIWGEDRTIDFTIGRPFVMRVEDSTHQMTVERDGKVVRTIPVSLGKPGYTTRSGVKVIMTQEESRRMDSATVSIGGSEAYDLEVPYAMRLTATGEFVHGAPWSEWAQGSQNVSHGCTNVSLANAIWLFENTLIGDPVVTTGTGRPTEEWNGLGAIWNFEWPQWQARSALT